MGLTVHYHMTPITPRAVLAELAGKHFGVSFQRPEQLATVHQIGQSVMLDNGAYSVWKRGAEADWTAYYRWCEEWLACPTTWAVIPDVVDGGSQLQDALVKEWPFRHRGAPVWHMDEPLDRLLRLCDGWPRVCIGSTAEYAVVGSDPWHARMTEAFGAVAARHRHLPWLHMLRGMQTTTWGYPFASVDSSDVAQNHHRPHNGARKMADRWDAAQCPARWTPRPRQEPLQLAALAAPERGGT
jgi:hypothetical protein